MRWWFKVNQNKLYRKYIYDPHGFIIRKAKLTRSFKFLLANFKYKYFKKIKSARYIYNLKKKAHFNLIRNKKSLNLGEKKKKNNNLNYAQKNKKFLYSKKKFKNINFYKNLKLTDWKFNFWNKFKNNYFQFSKKRLAKNNLKKFFFKKKIKRWNKLNALKYRLRIYNKKRFKPSKKHMTKKELKKKRKKLMARLIWLKINRTKRKKKTWWLLRIAIKKTAYFYGIKKLQKFRYINNLNNKTMALKSYYNFKLECMLNMVLFRLNLFDNIYIVNNFIRVCGAVVNGKTVLYPFRFIKVNDIISFHSSMFKKMFFIFVKRSKFNKSFLFKKLFQKKIKKFRLLHLLKNFINVPLYIEYNYKIMHFIIWRLPNRKEFCGAHFKRKDLYDWSLNTQLQYN